MVVLCFDLCPSSVDLGLRGWCRMLWMLVCCGLRLLVGFMVFACLDCGLLLVVRGVCFWIWWKCWFVDMAQGLG